MFIVVNKRNYKEQIERLGGSIGNIKFHTKDGTTHEIYIKAEDIIAIEDGCVYTKNYEFDDLIETANDILNKIIDILKVESRIK